MTKQDLFRLLAGVDDNTPIYLRVDHAGMTVECTDVDDTAQITDDEPIVILS
jgi:hypothetical protein